MLKKKKIDGKVIWEKENNYIFDKNSVIPKMEMSSSEVIRDYLRNLSDDIKYFQGCKIHISGKVKNLAMEYAENPPYPKIPLGGCTNAHTMMFIIVCALSDVLKKYKISKPEQLGKIKFSSNDIEDRLVRVVFE